MKKNLVFLSLMFVGLLLPQNIQAQTAKAIWCEENTTLYFLYNTGTYTIGGTYNGQLTITNVYDVPERVDYNNNSYIVPWKSISSLVTRVVISSKFSDFQPKTLNHWFRDFGNLKRIDGLGNINTSKLEGLHRTFDSCSKLTSIAGLENWDTSNLVYLTQAFRACSSLTSLEPLRGWNTSNVISLYGTFGYCEGLTSLEPLSGWNTINVTDMAGTFRDCVGLTSLAGIKNWNTGNVTNMSWTFAQCTALTSLNDIKKWTTSNVTTLQHIFFRCTSLTSLAGIKNWVTSNVTTMKSSFDYCESLTSLEPLRNWDTSKNTSLHWTFQGCRGITSLEPLSNWNTSNVTDMYGTFKDCHGLELVNMNGWKGWNTSKVTDMHEMFLNCLGLRGISFGTNFNMNKVSTADNMFNNCKKLRYIDFYNSSYATSGTGLQFPLNTVNRSSGVFNTVPETTVIFLPKENGVVTNVTNVVYSNNGNASDLRCPKYYSTDKVDIEFPRQFKTKEAVYSRTMGSKVYGSVVLPYAFTTNSDIQAYSLSAQNDEMTRLKFTNAKTVPAHTPFAFKRLNNAEFLMKNSNFGITVNATRSTNANEETWTEDAPTEAPGTPYVGTTGLSNWQTKGYYVKETVTDFDGMYFIQDNNVKRATGNLNLVDHRVLFYPTGAPGASKFFTMSFSDDEAVTAIEAAETEQTLRQAEGIYDATGRQQVTTRRGLNIVRMSDGTVKKVVVK